MDISTEVREAAEMVASALADSIVFYNEDGLGAVVIQYDAGGAYVVDINEHGNIQSGNISELSTGFDA